MCIQINYNKTRSVIGRDRPIKRYLDLKTSKLLLNYIVLLRPFMVGLAKECFDEPNLYDLKSLLCVDRTGKIIKDDYYRGKFKSIFSIFGSFSINVSGWRHYVKFIYLNYLQLPNDGLFTEMEEDDDDWTIQQFGHSIEVAKQYGTSNLAQMDYQFLKLSQQWHRFLFGSTFKTTFTTKISKRNQEYSPDESEKETQNIQAAVGLMQLSEPAMTSMQTARDLKRSLVKIHGLNCNWRSTEQSLAAARVYDSNRDVVICLPTGEGKTDIITCCLLSPKENKRKTLFLVPTIALLINLNQRLSKHVNTSVFGDGFEADASVIIATYQTATTEAVKTWVHRNAALGVLKRIVLDEAHTLLTWGDVFCLSFKDLEYLRPISLPIQMVFMSATLPIDLIEKMKKRYTINDSYLFYKSPNKPQLKYSRMVTLVCDC